MHAHRLHVPELAGHPAPSQPSIHGLPRTVQYSPANDHTQSLHRHPRHADVQEKSLPESRHGTPTPFKTRHRRRRRPP